jgi:thioredoxin reductase (NADPH)
VLLTTGAIDIEPELPDLLDAVARGLVRHCPICDAYEAIDQKIGLISWGGDCAGEATFLRTYSSDVTLLSLGRRLELTREQRRDMNASGVKLEEEPVVQVIIKEERIAALRFDSGREQVFDTLYSALGTRVTGDLALQLGADADADGALLTDAHQRTSVAGLWAAGDVVSGLNQLAVAFGQAAVAATDIHRQPLSRSRQTGTPAVEECQ